MIDGKRLPKRLVVEVRTPYRAECQCGREVCGTARKEIDIAPQVQQAVNEAIVGAFQLPTGNYEVVVNIGHTGSVLSAQMVKN